MMKRNLAVLAVAAAACVSLVVWGTAVDKHMTALPIVHAASPTGCSSETVAGNWGFTLSGTLILPTGPVPAAGIARGSFDAQGNVTPGATEARNVGGGFANETVTGSWTVNPDCTGTLTIHAYESGVLVRTSVLSIVFVDNLNKALMVQESLTLPDGTLVPAVITAEGKRIFPLNTNSQ